MKIGKRFLVWSLVGIFLTVGFSGWGRGVQAGYAADPTVEAVSQETDPLMGSADDLQVPDTPEPDTSEAEVNSEPEETDTPEPETSPDTEETEDTILNLPDFEPKLPSESLPDEVSAEDDETWNEAEVEASGEGTEDTKLSKQQQILITADQYYLEGDEATAETLYRQVKDEIWQVDPDDLRPAAILDPAELSPAGAVYWREAQAGYEQGLTHRTVIPLEILVEEYPAFIPGHVFYANYLVEQGRAEYSTTVKC
ncbi:MAG: hypothetical protein F6K42_31215 [Leptolyngbya sp. SIO1D8]|nr:hypothetical protein [Leptolyngbya sp. SIO1D8]